MADISIPSADEIRAIVTEVIAPLREEIARLRKADDRRGVPVSEAAERLGVSEKTIRRGVCDGSIPSAKVRGRRVVLIEQLLASEEHALELANRARRRR